MFFRRLEEINYSMVLRKRWRSQRESNPCFSLERATS
jgi:hypothetical protein